MGMTLVIKVLTPIRRAIRTRATITTAKLVHVARLAEALAKPAPGGRYEALRPPDHQATSITLVVPSGSVKRRGLVKPDKSAATALGSLPHPGPPRQ